MRKPNEDDQRPEVGAARQQVVANFDHELQRLKVIEHSAWAAFNAVSQYVDWERPTRGTNGSARDERRIEAMMLGVGAEPKRMAWTAALNLAMVS